jgi:hypothetical protein
MKGASVGIDWRTVQFFLSDEGVHEVEADAEEYKRMRCTCDVYKQGKRCKHVRYVKNIIEENNGVFSVRLPEDVSDETIKTAMEDADLFRDLLLHHAPIQVLK